jgi:hypothetical protein
MSELGICETGVTGVGPVVVVVAGAAQAATTNGRSKRESFIAGVVESFGYTCGRLKRFPLERMLHSNERFRKNSCATASHSSKR